MFGFSIKFLSKWIGTWSHSKLQKFLIYLEIGDLVDSQIKMKSLKTKTSTTICNQGDLLFASLTPSKAKVAIADQNYYISNAIYVISHQDQQMVKWLFTYLMNDEVIFKAINGLLDGFKITYAKISKFNLMNQVKLKIN